MVFTKTLVLDLDETLVHASDKPDELPRAPDFYAGPYGVLRRPGVAAFLGFALAHFEHVGVWTSATLGYAIPVIDRLVERKHLAFVWGRDRCTRRFDPETGECDWLKDIRKLTRREGGRYKKEQLLFVDDSPEKLVRSYGNLIAVRPFEGDPDDRELELLECYLRSLGHVENVRRIDKRRWQQRV